MDEVRFMKKHIFLIPNISCGHCVQAIKNELSEMDGIIRVEGDPAKKEIHVQYEEPATLEGIKRLLQEINYPVES